MFSEQSIEEIEEEKERWEKTTFKKTIRKLKEQKEEFTTLSGIPVKRLYTPEDIRDLKYLRNLGFSGEYPYTRGIYSTMYRGRLWTMRQVVGLGTGKDANKRHKYVLSQGQTGLSNDFDLPTCIGYDPDDPKARNEVGRVGVAISTLRDMEDLFEGIPLDKVSTSMTINGPAPILLAMYVVVAEKQGIAQEKLRGTLQNDPLKEYITQNMYLLPPEPSIKIAVDVIEYCTRHMPNWNPISLCAYQFRDMGATASQEIAFCFADGIEYIKAILTRGLSIDDFAPRFSFLLHVQNDFFEEIAKFRAARRVWARLIREKFGARKDESCRFRVHCQTGGCTLTAQQPEINVIRGTIQAFASVLGGVQSLAVSTRDEALSIPSEESQRISLRIQQVIAHESGAVNTVDPLGGSYYVEYLTDKLEQEIWEWLDRIEAKGGMVPCIKTGWIEKLISDQAYQFQKQIKSKEKIIVGLNKYIMENEKLTFETYRVTPEVEERQIRALKRFREARNSEKAQETLRKVRNAAENDENIVPPIIDAVKTRATLGEIMGALKEVYGEYKKLPVF